VFVEYNPFARDTQINPFPVYRWLRDESPVYHNGEVGFYALSRFDDVLQAHLDTSRFLSGHGVTIEDTGASADLLITKDEPEHTWHRKLVSRVFTSRAIAELEPAVRSVAAEALDGARDRGEMEVIGELSDTCRWRSSPRCSVYPSRSVATSASSPTACSPGRMTASPTCRRMREPQPARWPYSCSKSSVTS
jgi:hypothetical protein